MRTLFERIFEVSERRQKRWIGAAAVATALLLSACATAPHKTAHRGVWSSSGEEVATETQSNDIWQRIRNHFGIPDLYNAEVTGKENYYASRADYVNRMATRSGDFLYIIMNEIEQRNMPSEIALLPFVESAFVTTAKSSAQAQGLWQFIPSTGRDFSLAQNRFADQRNDVVASTSAALDYLQQLHDKFNDWQLALAAYNWGPGNVSNAVNRSYANGGKGSYSEIRMPTETRQYVPKLQAIKNIVRNPALYGITLPNVDNASRHEAITVTRDIDVGKAAELCGLSEDEFRRLNPAHKKQVIVAALNSKILVPADRADAVRHAFHSSQQLATLTTYNTFGTEALSDIAAKYNTDADRLRSLNAIPYNHNYVQSGSTLLVPRTRKDDDIPYVALNSTLRSISGDVGIDNGLNNFGGVAAVLASNGAASLLDADGTVRATPSASNLTALNNVPTMGKRSGNSHNDVGLVADDQSADAIGSLVSTPPPIYDVPKNNGWHVGQTPSSNALAAFDSKFTADPTPADNAISVGKNDTLTASNPLRPINNPDDAVFSVPPRSIAHINDSITNTVVPTPADNAISIGKNNTLTASNPIRPIDKPDDAIFSVPPLSVIHTDDNRADTAASTAAALSDITVNQTSTSTQNSDWVLPAVAVKNTSHSPENADVVGKPHSLTLSSNAVAPIESTASTAAIDNAGMSTTNSLVSPSLSTTPNASLEPPLILAIPLPGESAAPIYSANSKTMTVKDLILEPIQSAHVTDSTVASTAMAMAIIATSANSPKPTASPSVAPIGKNPPHSDETALHSEKSNVVRTHAKMHKESKQTTQLTKKPQTAAMKRKTVQRRDSDDDDDEVDEAKKPKLASTTKNTKTPKASTVKSAQAKRKSSSDDDDDDEETPVKNKTAKMVKKTEPLAKAGGKLSAKARKGKSASNDDDDDDDTPKKAIKKGEVVKSAKNTKVEKSSAKAKKSGKATSDDDDDDDVPSKTVKGKATAKKITKANKK